MKTIILIPSRMASTRLPGKPMAKINGKPMIQLVWEKAILSDIGDVYVACSEDEVFQTIKDLGGRAIMTDPQLASGTDRIHAAFKKIDNNQKVDFVINLQGDLPLINPQHIKSVINPLKKNFTMSTLATSLKKVQIQNPNITKIKVKWIDNELGVAKDFFRLNKKLKTEIYHHVGIYAYSTETLNEFVKLPKSKNEINLNLEQFRAMDANIKIGVSYISGIPIGIDTKEDLIYAESIIRENYEKS